MIIEIEHLINFNRYVYYPPNGLRYDYYNNVGLQHKADGPSLYFNNDKSFKLWNLLGKDMCKSTFNAWNYRIREIVKVEVITRY